MGWTIQDSNPGRDKTYFLDQSLILAEMVMLVTCIFWCVVQILADVLMVVCSPPRHDEVPELCDVHSPSHPSKFIISYPLVICD